MWCVTSDMVWPILLRLTELLRTTVHPWNRNPRPRPDTISNLVSLMTFNLYYMFLNWLSGILVGVGGSDFISYTVIWHVCNQHADMVARGCHSIKLISVFVIPLDMRGAQMSKVYPHPRCLSLTGVCEQKHYFCLSLGQAIQRQKLCFSPWFGALKAHLPEGLLLRRSIFVHRHGYLSSARRRSCTQHKQHTRIRHNKQTTRRSAISLQALLVSSAGSACLRRKRPFGSSQRGV